MPDPTGPARPQRLCEQCLTVSDDVRGFDLGPDRGSQRDPFRDQLWLCPDCSGPLLAHDMGAFCERYETERTVRR